MADCITPTDIPVSDPQTGRPWDLVAGYVDGLFAWSTAGWDRFPDSQHVRIAVFSTTNDGDVIDREPGDATADQAVDWVLMRRAAGHPDPTVYCSYFDWPNCRDAFDRRGVAQPRWWISGYPSPVDPSGEPIIPNGAVAHQFTDTPGGHWDESLVADYWPGVDPTPHPTNDPGDDDVAPNPVLFSASAVADVNDGNPLFPFGVWRDEFGVYVGLATAAERADLLAAYPSAVKGTSGDGVWLEQATLAELVRISRVGVDTPRQVNVTGVAVSGAALSVPGSWKVTDVGSGVTTVVAQA